MTQNLAKELAALEKMTTGQLKVKYGELFGDECRSGNRTWLVRRIAWRLQANVLGGLSERARQRAAELANEADLRILPPRVKPDRSISQPPILPSGSAVPSKTDARLPLPGTILVREYKGRSVQVRVLENGFEFEGDVYKSLSAVAKAITGSHCNGYLFFNLKREE